MSHGRGGQGQQNQGGGHVYLHVLPFQVCVVLLHLVEILLGFQQLAFPRLDLLILPRHLKQGLHLGGTDQGQTLNK